MALTRDGVVKEQALVLLPTFLSTETWNTRNATAPLGTRELMHDSDVQRVPSDAVGPTLIQELRVCSRPPPTTVTVDDPDDMFGAATAPVMYTTP